MNSQRHWPLRPGRPGRSTHGSRPRHAAFEADRSPERHPASRTERARPGFIARRGRQRRRWVRDERRLSARRQARDHAHDTHRPRRPTFRLRRSEGRPLGREKRAMHRATTGASGRGHRRRPASIATTGRWPREPHSHSGDFLGAEARRSARRNAPPGPVRPGPRDRRIVPARIHARSEHDTRGSRPLRPHRRLAPRIAAALVLAVRPEM